MRVLEKHIVPEGVSNVRLSDYAGGIFTHIPSRKGMKKAIKRGEVRVDGQLADSSHWVQSGQVIELLESDQNPPKPYHMPLEIVYQDDYLAVVNKPAGLVVSGNQFRTLQNVLVHHIPASQVTDAYQWPHPLHRLDAPTSGLVMVGRAAKAAEAISDQFKNHTIKKRYRAIVMGKIAEEGTVDRPLQGKKALTRYRRLEMVRSLKSDYLCLVDLFPQTGRTHQLRKHLSAIGHAILGDPIYSPEALRLKGKGLFLCAVELRFNHPVTKKVITVTIEEPPKFRKFMVSEDQRWMKYH